MAGGARQFDRRPEVDRPLEREHPVSAVRAAIVPVGSIVLLACLVLLVCGTAGKTFGYDFEAYAGAARRLLSGDRLYDPNVSVAGAFAIYLYPPPFAIAFVPFVWLPDAVAKVVWMLAMAACVPIGALLLPVRRDLRWVIVILAAVDWPYLYSVKLGQVGPLLFLLFAIAWRFSNRPAVFAGSVVAGALVKVQPALLAVWALGYGRLRAALLSGAAIVVIAGLATVVVGLGAWADYVSLLGRVSNAVATPHNFSIGAVAYRAGASEQMANAIQALSTASVVASLVLLWRFGTPEATLIAAMVASQVLTPLLWDHYSVVLLLPVAWLMARGRMWAPIFVLAGWISLFANQGQVVPSASVPLVFYLCLLAVVAQGIDDRRRATTPDPSLRQAPEMSGAPRVASGV